MEPAAKILVTGSTGFIGMSLVENLVRRGYKVRAMSRRMDPPPPPGVSLEDHPLHHENVEMFQGDVTDRDAVFRAVEGCSLIFHLAACAVNWASSPTVFEKANVEAVRHILDAAKELGVERTVWTSTIMTFGPTPRGVVADETTPRWIEESWTDYESTKRKAEEMVLERAANGEDIVVVNPTRVYGPGRLSESNAVTTLIRDYPRGRVPILPHRGVDVGNYIYVDDVVEGHILAMERGRSGQRYILGGDENVSLREFFIRVAKITGKRRGQLPIGKLGPKCIARFQLFLAKRFGVHPMFTPGWVKVFFHDWAYSSKKAQQELGFSPRPLEDGIRSTYEWLRSLE
jgi:nucleoside-diphosphate-sugar epimerase